MLLFGILIFIAVFLTVFPFNRFLNAANTKIQKPEEDKEIEDMKIFVKKMKVWKEEFHQRM